MVQIMKLFTENSHLECFLSFRFKRDICNFGIKLMNILQELIDRDQKNKVLNHKVRVQILVKMIKIVIIVNKQEIIC
jgi:hypothetical protein